MARRNNAALDIPGPVILPRRVTRDDGISQTTDSREKRNLAPRMSHTSDDNGRFVRDLAFTDCQSRPRGREREGVAPRITNNSRPRVILDLAWEVAGYLLLSVSYPPFRRFSTQQETERLGDTDCSSHCAYFILFFFPLPLFFFYSRALSQSRESSCGLSSELIFALKSCSTGLSGISKRRYAHVPRERSRFRFLAECKSRR